MLDGMDECQGDEEERDTPVDYGQVGNYEDTHQLDIERPAVTISHECDDARLLHNNRYGGSVL